MKVKGKWYLWLNVASPSRLYWDGDGWVTDPQKAMFFNRQPGAVGEARRHAGRTTKAEVVVDQAMKDL